MKKIFLLFGLILAYPTFLWAASTDTVTVTESNDAVEVASSIGGGCVIANPAGGASVYVARLDATSGAALAAPRGEIIATGASTKFIPSEDGWSGGLWAILASGSTDIVLAKNCW